MDKYKLSEQIEARRLYPYLPAPGELDELFRGWSASAAEFESIVEKLPVTADGKVVVPGRDAVWGIVDGIIESTHRIFCLNDKQGWNASFFEDDDSLYPMDYVWSTYEAACQAAEGKGGE